MYTVSLTSFSQGCGENNYMKKIATVEETRKYFKEQNDFLSKIESCDWFSKVGKANSKKLSRASSWEEAFQLSSPEEESMQFGSFGDYFHDLNNACGSFAAKTDRDLFNRDWNRLVTRSDKLLSEFFKTVVFKKIPSNGRPKLFCSLVEYGFSMELTLLAFCGRSFKELTFHNSLFLEGFCPCGYQGSYPDGNLILY